MPILTRAEIYGNEAAQLLQEISMYPGVLERQLYHFHPGKEDKVKILLSQLIKQGRVKRETDSSYYISGLKVHSKDHSLIKAVWVLLDFLERAEYHSASDFPVKIAFFAEGEEYEIICVPQGQEPMMTQAVQRLKEGYSKRIVLVDIPEQISALDFPCISGYCTVDKDGTVHYYQRRKG